MHSSIRTTATVALAAAALAATTTGAVAAAPSRVSESFPFTGVVDSCGTFDVIGDAVFRSTATTYADGSMTIHLHATGTFANSVTGLTGRYAEIQLDRTTSSGSGFSAGLFSRLTVPGRGTVGVLAGRAVVDATGHTTYTTPHAAGLADDDAFHRSLCEALS